MTHRFTQLELFGHVAGAYADANDGRLTNAELYAAVARRADVSPELAAAATPVGHAKTRHKLFARKVRWIQQTLRQMGILNRVDGERGVWQFIDRTKRGLHEAVPETKLVAFSTSLGVAIWGDCFDVLKGLQEEVALYISSPPYLLQRQRAYGNPTEIEYVDFITASIEPVIRNLIPGASVCLNLGVDAFLPGLPARSLYLERLILALHDRLGLSLMDRAVWHNPTKPPGPLIWSSMRRVQLNASYESVVWMTNDPSRVRADNRRVLEPHTEQHVKLMARGGEKRTAVYGDGAYTVAPGRYSQPTAGRIPRNVMRRGHRCADTQRLRAHAKALGLPMHGAVFPTWLPDFWIRFLTEEGDLVVDAHSGWNKTGLAAQRLKRRWLIIEKVLDYVRTPAEMFRQFEGFEMSPWLESWSPATGC